MICDKIRELKKQHGMTNARLAELSGVPLGTLGKIVSGTTKDPQLETLRAIATALGVRIDDLTSGEDIAKTGSYYASSEVANIAQEIYDNPEQRILFDASRKLSKEDVLAVVDIVKRMRSYSDSDE